MSASEMLRGSLSATAFTAARIIDWKDFIFTVTQSKTSNSNTLWSQMSQGQVWFTFHHDSDKIHKVQKPHPVHRLQLIFLKIRRRSIKVRKFRVCESHKYEGRCESDIVTHRVEARNKKKVGSRYYQAPWGETIVKCPCRYCQMVRQRDCVSEMWKSL